MYTRERLWFALFNERTIGPTLKQEGMVDRTLMKGDRVNSSIQGEGFESSSIQEEALSRHLYR